MLELLLNRNTLQHQHREAKAPVLGPLQRREEKYLQGGGQKVV
jgi:hypothetical protein